MFIFDFVADQTLSQILDWVYAQAVGFLGDFFTLMGTMGSELFEMQWVEATVLLFHYFAWALYIVGCAVAVFECAIEMQSGRGSTRDLALNTLKGLLSVSLFTVVPVELYQFCVDLQGVFSRSLSGFWEISDGIGGLASDALLSISLASVSPIMGLFCVFMMGYAIIKVFFANLKRGGILLIQIAVGSLYMFSVPRGYLDGFTSWCKQIVGLCFTAFLQASILTAGLMVFRQSMLLGLGLMLASSEIPRIAGQFGLDTSTKANVMGAVHTAQSAVSVTRTIAGVVAK